jgi:hypothetical protein
MITLKLILLILAFVSLFMAALGITTTRINLMALGLALWVLAIILTP